MLMLPKIQTVCNDQFVAFGRTEYGMFASDTEDTIYKLFNDNFTVTVNGEDCQVRECRVSAIPFNRPWPGKQRPYEQSESAAYITFYADEPVTLRVRSCKPFAEAKLRPLSKNVIPHCADGEITFALKEFGSYVLELDGTHNVLHIFYNPYKEYPEAHRATHYFGPGIHFPMLIPLKDGDTVYVDKEAIVFGSIFTAGAKNVKIYGGGVIDNSCEERLTENCYEPFTKGAFRIYDSQNIDVSDLILVNSSNFVLSMFNCRHVTVDNVKIVGQWRYNTDGIDVVNSSDVTIRNCFIRSFDDVISLKAIYDCDRPLENITVDNCVLWCGWSKNCEVGIEASGVEYKHIRFKNCDLIHSLSSAFSISNGGYADMHDIRFENMRVELQKHPEAMELQTADSQPYTGYGKPMATRLVACSNQPYRIRLKGPVLRRELPPRLGRIHDISFRNIDIIAEDIDYTPQIAIESVSRDLPCRSIHFENIQINGERQTDFSVFDPLFVHTEDVSIR